MPGRSKMLTLRPSGSSAMPVCCSTVTPGKLATFRSERHLLVFGARVEAVDAGEVHDADAASVGEFGDAGVLFHRNAGEIGYLLAQPGETVEQGGLTGVRRPHQRHGTHRRRAEQFRDRRTATAAAMAIAAIAHGILRVLRNLSGLSFLTRTACSTQI